MGNFKFWDDIDAEDFELYEQKESIIADVLINLYQQEKNKPNVIDDVEVYRLQNKTSFFGSSIWEGVIPISSNVIFGLRSGVVFKDDSIVFLTGKEFHKYFDISYFSDLDRLKVKGNNILGYPEDIYKITCSSEDIAFILEFQKRLRKAKEKFNFSTSESINKEHSQSEMQKDRLKELKDQEMSKLDENGDGEIDLMEYLDFSKTLQKNQSIIAGIDNSHIHKFIKLSNYLKEKHNNIKSLYNSLSSNTKEILVTEENYLDDEIIRGIDEDELQSTLILLDLADSADEAGHFEKPFLIELNNEDLLYRIELIKNLNNLVYSYNLMIFHSFNMISSLVSGDLISYYEIYEMFDKLGVYNSNWENEVAQKLKSIGNKLDELFSSINEMEENLVKEMKSMNYTMHEGFSKLTSTVNKQLQEIDSTMKWGNLISTIQTFQLYKINKQTKPQKK
jgi:hypothetical protein